MGLEDSTAPCTGENRRAKNAQWKRSPEDRTRANEVGQVGQLHIRENPIKNRNLANDVEPGQLFCGCLVGLEDSTAPYEDEPRKATTSGWKPHPTGDKLRADEVGEVGQLHIRENPIKNRNLANYVELGQLFCGCLVGLEDSTAPYEDEPRKAKTGWWKPYPAEDKSRTDEVGQVGQFHIRENFIKNRNLANDVELGQPFCDLSGGLRRLERTLQVLDSGVRRTPARLGLIRRLDLNGRSSTALDDASLSIAYDLKVNGDGACRGEGCDDFGDLCLKFQILN